MNQFEQIREAAAKIAEFEDVPTYTFGGTLYDDAGELKANISEKIRAMSLPEVVQCEYCGGSGDVHRADGEWLGICNCADGMAIRIETLSAENERLKKLLHETANGLRWYQDEHPEDLHECDYEMLEKIDAALKGGAA